MQRSARNNQPGYVTYYSLLQSSSEAASLSKPQETTGLILLDKVPLPTVAPAHQPPQHKLFLLSNLSH